MNATIQMSEIFNFSLPVLLRNTTAVGGVMSFRGPVQGAGLEALVVLLVLLAFALEAVVAVAVVAATLAAVAHVEAGVHLRQRVHAEDLVHLAEGQQPQGKLQQPQRRQLQQGPSATSRGQRRKRGEPRPKLT